MNSIHSYLQALTDGWDMILTRNVSIRSYLDAFNAGLNKLHLENLHIVAGAFELHIHNRKSRPQWKYVSS